METIFQPQYWLLWGAALSLLLFFPIRKIIWVMSVNTMNGSYASEWGNQEPPPLEPRAACSKLAETGSVKAIGG